VLVVVLFKSGWGYFVNRQQMLKISAVERNWIPSVASHGHEFPGLATAMATGSQRRTTEHATQLQTPHLEGGVCLRSTIR
jgi:hypothetical protein